MFYMWTCFSLLCAATILQISASTEFVSLKCNDTVEVVAGEDVTLTCRIIDTSGDNCEGEEYQWSNSHGDIQCNSDLKEYICGWDKLTYVYLTISNVIKDENYTVAVLTDCVIAQSSAIKVRLQPHSDQIRGATEPSLSQSHEIPTILGILAAIAVVGFLCFLFITNRGRQIINRMKKEKTQTEDNSESERENVLNV
ncbi:uncharacterized protein LOC122970953 [Scomber scombrus]|uniref:Uncharacterized protein LOC122970953 n=1 Tax=Scomber scombrus TaxID=13677 RepID=A0AAV1QH11_SCOSC